MKNCKGQALVEFILIIPVFAFLILGIIDIGNIVINKYNLESGIEYYEALIDLIINVEDTNLLKRCGSIENYIEVALESITGLVTGEEESEVE
jgi:hypothetical protein